MGTGYSVDPEQLRDHAKSLESLKDRFEAVRTASSHIEQDDEAYGLFCVWMTWVMDGRHQRQDELVDYLAENLGLAAEALRGTAGDYEDSDDQSSSSLDDLRARME